MKMATSTIEHGISVSLKDEFARIRDNYQNPMPRGQPLSPNWPIAQSLERSAQFAAPLFILGARDVVGE